MKLIDLKNEKKILILFNSFFFLFILQLVHGDGGGINGKRGKKTFHFIRSLIEASQKYISTKAIPSLLFFSFLSFFFCFFF